MLKECVSNARQMQVKRTLEVLRLRSIERDKDIDDVAEGLTKIVEHIHELSPQCPPDFRSDVYKIDYLRKAFTEFQEWSRIPIQNITSQGYSFNAFVIALHESVQNLRQIELLVEFPRRPNFTGITEEEQFDTNVMQYGRNPRFNKHRKWNGSRSKYEPRSERRGVHSSALKRVTFEDSRRRNECHRCGAPNWNPKHRFEKGSITAHARNRIQNGESSIRIVADMVQQLEGELSTSDGEDVASGIMFGNAEQKSDLAEFDSCLSQDGSVEEAHGTRYTELIELAEQEIHISQLAAAIAGRDLEGHLGFSRRRRGSVIVNPRDFSHRMLSRRRSQT